MFGLAFSPDGKLLAVGDGDGAVHLWDPATGEGRGSLSPDRTEFRPPPSWAVTFTADGTRLVRGRRSHLEWWGVAELTQDSGRKPQPLTPVAAPVAAAPVPGVFPGETADVLALHLSAGARTLTVAHADRSVRHWDVASRRLVNTAPALDRLRGAFRAAAFAPDGRVVALAGKGLAQTLDWRARRVEGLAEAPRTLVFCATYSADGKAVALGYHDGQIEVWDVPGARLRVRFRGHTGAATAVAFSPDGKQLASASADGVRLWEAGTGREQARMALGGDPLRGDQPPVRALAFSLDGNLLASAESVGVRLWDVAAKGERASFRQRGAFQSVAFSPRGDLLAAGARDGSVRLWEPAGGAGRGIVAAEKAVPVRCLAFSAEGAWLAVGAGRDARLVSLAEVAGAKPGEGGPALEVHKKVGGLPFDGRGRVVLKGHSGQVGYAAFLPGGRRLLTGSGDNTVKIWDTATGRLEDTLRAEHNRPLDLMALSADGEGLFLADRSALFRQIRSVALNADGTLLAVSARTDVELCDVASAARQAQDGRPSPSPSRPARPPRKQRVVTPP